VRTINFKFSSVSLSGTGDGEDCVKAKQGLHS